MFETKESYFVIFSNSARIDTLHKHACSELHSKRLAVRLFQSHAPWLVCFDWDDSVLVSDFNLRKFALN